MKPFIDTNVLLEHVMQRDNGELVRKLFIKLSEHNVQYYVSYLTMANAAYILKRGKTKDDLQVVMKKVQGYVSILGCSSRQMKQAIAHSPVRDFEDLLQYQCAKDNHCDSIVTFNKKDYYFADDITILTPEEFIGQLSE